MSKITKKEWSEMEKMFHQDYISNKDKSGGDDEKEVDPQKFISDLKDMFPGTQIIGVLPTDPNNPNSGVIGLGPDGLEFGDGFTEL